MGDMLHNKKGKSKDQYPSAADPFNRANCKKLCKMSATNGDFALPKFLSFNRITENKKQEGR
jgi:hypothetical protein